jgi:hypothetical protein
MTMATENDTMTQSTDPAGSNGPDNDAAAKSANASTAPAASSKSTASAAERPRKKIRVKTGKRKSKARVWKTRWVRAEKPGSKSKAS